MRDSVMADVYVLASHLRSGDAAEIEALGLDPRRAVRDGFRDGILRKSYFVDGELAAMSGLCGAMVSDDGEPYLLTTPVAERVPRAFVRHAHFAVEEMLSLRSRLSGEVAASYTKACRLLAVLGFSLSEPHPLGPKGALFRTYSKERD